MWFQIPDAPYGVSDGGAAVINGKIYMIGDPFVDGIQVYDPATNSWNTGSIMPTRRDGIVVGAVGGKLYVIGGRRKDDGSRSGIVEEYDPATNTWATKASMPTPRAFSATATVDNVIYVIGGDNGGFLTGITEAYDPATNTWSPREDMPTRRSLAATAVLGTKIYVIGGSGNVVEELDTLKQDTTPYLNETWSSRNPLGTPRSGCVAGSVNGKVYVIGGNNSSGDVLVVEEGSLTAAPDINVSSKSGFFLAM